MSEKRYYENIIEVYEGDVDTANKLLAQGWELLKIDKLERTNVSGDRVIQESVMVYVLGRRAEGKEIEEEKIKEVKPEEIAPSILEKLPWKAYQEGGKAGWIFSDEKRHSDENKELVKWLKGYLERHSKDLPIKIGDYKYNFSGDGKFISRRPIK